MHVAMSNSIASKFLGGARQYGKIMGLIRLESLVEDTSILESRWLRVLCGFMGALLLGNALILMLYGMFNVGVLLPATLGLALLCLVFYRQKISRLLNGSGKLRGLWGVGWTVFALWFASLLAFWLYIAQHTRSDTVERPIDALIVLGSATHDGQPSLTLAHRLDVAAALAHQHPAALVVTSGGVDFGERESEGRVMARYLTQRHGMDPARVIMEEHSTSTALNLSLSQLLLSARGLPTNASVSIVTSDFHTLRAKWIADKAGLRNVETVGAPTPLSIRFNAWLREYFAVLSSWALGEF